MAEKSWKVWWTDVKNYFAGYVQKSVVLVKRVQANVAAFILLLAARLLRFCEKHTSSKLFLECSRFPYQGDKINEWFVERIPSEDGREQGVNVMNVDLEGIRTDIYRTKGQANNFPNCLSNDQFDVFLHGTNHASAQDITERGIDLGKARKGVLQDFSDGDGFYVCDSFKDAFDWAKSNFRPCEGQAVLIYRVDKRQLRGEDNKYGLDLRNNESEWLRVVREYRKPNSCHGNRRRRSEPIDKTLRKSLKQLHFIEGPITSGSQSNPSSTDFYSDTYQLCIRNRICAQLFDNSLHSVVFFQG